MYDKVMEKTILETIRSYYPSLTKKELEICKQVIISTWNLLDIQEDIENGYL